MKKIIVISLGGSLIIPKEMDIPFLNNFKKTLKKHYKTHKFVVVCGGGVIARKYISALKNKSRKSQSKAGIMATRENARFMMQLFGKSANSILPLNMKQIKSQLSKNSVVFCGALRFDPIATTDTTTAKLSHYFNTPFINITNVKGFYSTDPNKNPKAKFIKSISWKEFKTKALKIKNKPGQHFILDQKAAVIIYKYKIPTYIIGKNLKNLDKILKNKKFTGTIIKN
jgi:uridylate kinase